ncbi:MAG: hypothetical protein H7318_19690 [Oligoflexus sp.]|nr:hypothetical protein [Oligoflexus sp.]
MAKVDLHQCLDSFQSGHLLFYIERNYRGGCAPSRLGATTSSCILEYRLQCQVPATQGADGEILAKRDYINWKARENKSNFVLVLFPKEIDNYFQQDLYGQLKTEWTATFAMD